MENKKTNTRNARLYFSLGILTLGIISGIVLSLAYNLSRQEVGANLLAKKGNEKMTDEQDFGTGELDEGTGELDEGTGELDDSKPDDGSKPGNKKLPWVDPRTSKEDCKSLIFVLEKLGEKGLTDTDEYADTKEKYNANCVEKYQDGAPEDECKVLEEKINTMIEAGDSNSEEYAQTKNEFIKMCFKKPAGNVKPFDACGELKLVMEKYSDDPGNYYFLKAQEKYDRHCTGGADGEENICYTLKHDINQAILNGETDTDEYLKNKLTYQDLCTEVQPSTDRCKLLDEKINNLVETGDTSSEDYQTIKDEYLKLCQKDMPLAGYEDDVITDGDEMENPFSDVSLDTLVGKAFAELYRRGIIGGFKDGTARPGQLVNRAEAAKFLLLARYNTLTEDGAETTTFGDVKAGEWYVKFISRAAELGIISGYGDGTFKPGSPVNTAEFLKMLTLTFELETGLPYTYSDVLSTDWFSAYAGIGELYSLFPEWTAGVLQPAKQLTRGDVAVAMYQYLLNR